MKASITSFERFITMDAEIATNRATSFPIDLIAGRYTCTARLTAPRKLLFLPCMIEDGKPWEPACPLIVVIHEHTCKQESVMSPSVARESRLNDFPASSHGKSFQHAWRNAVPEPARVSNRDGRGDFIRSNRARVEPVHTRVCNMYTRCTWLCSMCCNCFWSKSRRTWCIYWVTEFDDIHFIVLYFSNTSDKFLAKIGSLSKCKTKH